VKKMTLEAWTREGWVLKTGGIGVYHTMLWAQPGGEALVKVKITIEETDDGRSNATKILKTRKGK